MMQLETHVLWLSFRAERGISIGSHLEAQRFLVPLARASE
jgi:hypothetical protein